MKVAKKKSVRTVGLFDPPANALAPPLSERTSAVKAWIEGKPGAEGRPFTPRRNSLPLVVIYKVQGKMFAILSVRGIEDVILKWDPLLIPVLRKEYSGVGHRSHLDKRYWISVRLDADVPATEIKRLVTLSYELVCSNLTARQKAGLARSGAPR